MAKAAKKTAKKSGSNKRDLIAPHGNKEYAKRDAKGQFKEIDDQTRSLREDVKKPAKRKVKPGYGDQGDQAKRKSAAKKKS